VQPKIIFRGGEYSLRNVEEGHEVWILLDPTRCTDAYFIIENRWRGTSYDRLMSDDSRLAVWHIMEKPEIYNSVPPPPYVTQEDWNTTSGDWGRRKLAWGKTKLWYVRKCRLQLRHTS